MSARRSEAVTFLRALVVSSCALLAVHARGQQSSSSDEKPAGGTYYPGPPAAAPPGSPGAPSSNPPPGPGASGLGAPGALPPGLGPAGGQPPGPGAPGAQPPGQFPPSSFGATSPTAPPSTAAPAPIPLDAKVVDIRLVGNRRVTRSEIIAKMHTKADRPFDQATLERDVRALATWGKFIDVKTRKEAVPGGVLVTIEVIERPTLEYVKFLGNKKVGRMALAKQVDLKKGSPLEPYAIEEGKRKLEEYYRGKGFNDVQVSILEGTLPDDHGAVYLIHEGPPQKIAKVDFVGNTITTDGRLKTQVTSKPPILWLFKGEVDRKKIEEDKEHLTAYYRGLGFFRAHVGVETEWNETEDRLTITFVIDEGPRAKVRDVKILGNSKFNFDQLSHDLELKKTDWFDQTKLTKDVTTLRDLYGGEGYVFCDVQPETRVIEDGTAMDMVYVIREGDRYRVSRINVHIESTDSVHPHTSQRTVLNRLSLRPGDIIDVNKLRQSERRLKASSLFVSDPSKGKPPTIIFTPPDSENPDANGESVARKPKKRGRGSGGTFRGQSPDPSVPEYPDETDKTKPFYYPDTKSGFWRRLVGPKSADSDPAKIAADSVPAAGSASAAEAGDQEPMAPWSQVSVQLEPVPAGDKPAAATQSPAIRSSVTQSNATQAGVIQSASPQRLAVQPASPQRMAIPRPQVAGPFTPSTRLAPARPVSNDGPARLVSNDDPGRPAVIAAQRIAVAMPPVSASNGVAQASYQAPVVAISAANFDSAPPTAGIAGRGVASGKAGAGAGGGAISPTRLNPNFGPPSPPTRRYMWFAMMDHSPGWLDEVQQPTVVNLGPDLPSTESLIFRGQDPNSGFGAPPGGYNPMNPLPPGAGPGAPLVPGAGPPGLGGPPPGSPLEDPVREIPLDVYATESQTGRLMFGAGINSNAGLVGNVTIDERNFNWRRIPTTSEAWRNGTAFRGAGQRFNISLSPGTYLQRYSISFSEPYLFDTPVSFGLSGAYFQRYYQNWTEQRAGGRVATGYQITPDLSGSVAFSGDNVKISNPSNPSEPQLARVLGNTVLMGVTGSLIYDTRDNTFLATQGHYYNLSIEQAFGTYVFPRAVLDARRFFTLHQRPDGSGRHVVAVSAVLGVEGHNAPLYEDFFAGGIGTIRGFYYRGASPVDQGVIVGGTTEALWSVEYVFPITADDMLRGTVFCDAGMIESGFTYEPSSIRVAPGFGILINVPAMGPAPINVGIAIPVVRNPADTLQYFYFSMGFGR